MGEQKYRRKRRVKRVFLTAAVMIVGVALGQSAYLETWWAVVVLFLGGAWLLFELEGL